jgi:hypothetical protein
LFFFSLFERDDDDQDRICHPNQVYLVLEKIKHYTNLTIICTPNYGLPDPRGWEQPSDRGVKVKESTCTRREDADAVPRRRRHEAVGR